MKKQKLSSNSSGFTILELIIATTVFSVMMLLATAGITQIGKIYYKGITTARTQETARAIVDDISQDLQTSPSTALGSSDGAGNGGDGPGGAKARCIGLTRYTYRTGVKLDPSGTPAVPHVLWVDRLKTGSRCQAVGMNLASAIPSDGNSDTTPLGISARKELMARNMRLAQFGVVETPNNPSTIRVSARVIYGDTDLTAPDGISCLPINTGGQFCAVSSLNAFVKKRL